MSNKYTEIVPGDTALLLGIRNWSNKYEDEHTSLPVALDEWINEFTHKTYTNARRYIKIKNMPDTTESGMAKVLDNSLNTRITVSIQDYP